MFSVLVDEGKDASGHEQLAIVLRYTDQNNVPCERFFEMKQAALQDAQTLYDLTVEALKDAVKAGRVVGGSGDGT